MHWHPVTSNGRHSFRTYLSLQRESCIPISQIVRREGIILNAVAKSYDDLSVSYVLSPLLGLMELPFLYPDSITNLRVMFPFSSIKIVGDRSSHSYSAA
jgi:hypothetical protein